VLSIAQGFGWIVSVQAELFLSFLLIAQELRVCDNQTNGMKAKQSIATTFRNEKRETDRRGASRHPSAEKKRKNPFFFVWLTEMTKTDRMGIAGKLKKDINNNANNKTKS
jgi:hypothetical protein